MPKENEKRLDKIKRLAGEKNLSLTEVFREAKIPHSTIQNWERKEPEAFHTYDTLIETVKRMEPKQAEHANG